MYYFALFVNLPSDTHWAWDSVRGSSCPYHSAVATLASPREHLLKICLENFHFLNLVLQLSLSLCEDLRPCYPYYRAVATLAPLKGEFNFIPLLGQNQAVLDKSQKAFFTETTGSWSNVHFKIQIWPKKGPHGIEQVRVSSKLSSSK